MVSSLQRNRLHLSMYSMGLNFASLASGSQVSLSIPARMNASVFCSRCCSAGIRRGTSSAAHCRAFRARASSFSMSSSTPSCGCWHNSLMHRALGNTRSRVRREFRRDFGRGRER
jgi:hypothetical protein